MLEIFIICKNNTAAFERLLISATSCQNSGIHLTAITVRPQKLEALQKKYVFSVLHCHPHSCMAVLNKAIQASDAEFFMILTEEHIIGAEFTQILPVALQLGGFSLLNMGYMPNWHTFAPLYPQENAEITNCLTIRPCIFGCIFDAGIVRQNRLTIHSMSIMEQYKYLQQLMFAGASAMYLPSVNLYIEKIRHCGQSSLFQALLCRSSSQMLQRIWLEDRKSAIKNTHLYGVLREAKWIFKTEYKPAIRKQFYLLKCRAKCILKNYI